MEQQICCRASDSTLHEYFVDESAQSLGGTDHQVIRCMRKARWGYNDVQKCDKQCESLSAAGADVEVEVLANLPLVRADALQPTVEVLLQAMRYIRNLGYRYKLVPLTSQGCSGRGSMHCYGQQLLDPGKTVSSNLCFMHYNDVQCSCHGTNRCIVRQPE